MCELTRSFGRWAPAAAGCAPRSWPPLDRGSAHKAALGWLGAHLGRQAHAQRPGLLMAPSGRTTVRSSRIGWAARRGVLGKTQPSGAAGLGRRRAGEYLAIPAVHGSTACPHLAIPQRRHLLLRVVHPLVHQRHGCISMEVGNARQASAEQVWCGAVPVPAAAAFWLQVPGGHVAHSSQQCAAASACTHLPRPAPPQRLQ